jgi:hypothetical protein
MEKEKSEEEMGFSKTPGENANEENSDASTEDLEGKFK